MLGLLPLELDTGPWTKKSSTLCSLLLLLTIGTLAVPGQANSEIVGLGNHTKNGENVTLTANTVTSDKAGFDLASCRFKEQYPGACDVSIEKGYIELRYNYGSKGCTVDLLSTNPSNINKIKFKTGVRGESKGGLNRCLDESDSFEKSYNNTLPFVYSVNNKDIEQLNTRQAGSDATCKDEAKCTQIGGRCRQNTSLQVSWNKAGKDIYAHTHLIGEERRQARSRYSTSVDDSVIFNLEINNSDEVVFDGLTFNPSTEAVCVSESTPLFEPKTWTITDGDHKGKHLLVFSLLRQTSSLVYLTKDHPNGPFCELFIQFNASDYKLLLVNPRTTTSSTTSTTTEAPSTGTSEPPETTTAPSGSSSTTFPTTDNSFPSIRTTSQAATKRPEKEECGGGLYTAIGTAAAGLFVGIIIAVLVWFWMRDKAKKDKKKWKQDAERAEDKRLLALYKAEAKLKGKKALGTFDEWKKNRKESDETTAFEMGSVDDMIAVIWKKVEKDHAKAKMQFLVDQFEKHRDKEVYDREYEPEKTKKGYDAVGRYQDWKMRRNIYPFEVIDGTSTALEYGRGKKAYDKPFLPGAVDESIPETE